MGALELPSSTFKSIMPASETSSWSVILDESSSNIFKWGNQMRGKPAKWSRSWSGVLEPPASSKGGSGGETELAESPPAVSYGRAVADLVVGSGANIIGNRCSSLFCCVRQQFVQVRIESGFIFGLRCQAISRQHRSSSAIPLLEMCCPSIPHTARA